MVQIARPGTAALLLLALWCGYQLVWSETIAAGNGLGFDGQFYGNLALAIAHGKGLAGIDAYRMQRVAPSLLVGGLLRITGARGIGDVVSAFKILTAAELMAAMAIWIRLTGLLRIAGRPFWIGTALAFASFGIARNSFYYPVSTDTTAFLLGLALSLAYLRGSVPWLFALGVAGSFVWPICGAATALALALPYGRVDLGRERDPVGALAGVAAGAVAVAAGAAMVFLLGRTRAGLGPVAEISGSRIWYSLALHAAFLLGALAILGRHVPVLRPGTMLRALDRRGLVAAGLVLAGPRLATALLASPGPPLLSLKGFAGMLALLPLVQPGLTPVAHFAYFGLLVPLLIVFWPGVAAAAARGGPGVLVVLLLALVVALTPESRQSMMTLPVFALLLCVAMRERAWSRWAAGSLVAAQLALLLFAGPQNAGAHPGASGIAQLPGYFARQGPYMDAAAYRTHLLAFTAALAGVLLLLLRWGPARAPRRIRP